MDKNKLILVVLTVIFIGFVFSILGCFYLGMKIQKKNEIINEQESLLQIHEGNTFNLRDDIAVLQDSIRLIKSGDIQFERDTLNKIK